MAVWNTNPSEQIQKYLDNFLKYIQTNIDITYGSDNDNSDKPLNIDNIPIAFQGTCLRSVNCTQISGNSPNGFSGDMYFKYDLTVTSDGSEMVSNCELLGGSQFLIENVDNTYYTNLWTDFENCNYSVVIKPELVDGYLYLPNDINNNNDFTKQYHLYQNDYDYTNVSNSVWSGFSSVSGNQLFIEPWNVDYTISQSSYNWLHGDICSVNTHGRTLPNCWSDRISYHMPTTLAPSVMFTDNTTVINNYTTYNNSNTYNTNNNYNNVINTYAGDNYLVIAPVSVSPEFGLNFNFDDLVGALEVTIGDLNENLGYGITVPTYDELKYQDQGSFYITPVKQIPPLPAAPDIADTVIDVSDYVTLLGGSLTKCLDLFDAVGLELMLTFTVLSCLVIRHLKR